MSEGLGGATAAQVYRGAAAALVMFGVGSGPGAWTMPRQSQGWGCTAESVDLMPGSTGVRLARAAIPPVPLGQGLAALRLGEPFPRGRAHNLALAPGQVPAVEEAFCARDPELACAAAADRERIVGDLLARMGRLAARTAARSAGRAAAQHVRDDLAQGRVPVMLFRTTMRNGPTAGVIRFRDQRSGRWILALAVARDFTAAPDGDLFLDGVILQEAVHYDDLAYLPDPLRCYESNLEIRGHYAMMSYWRERAAEAEAQHARIQLALTARLGASSPRTAWYRYLNRVQKTDFFVEDELVSLEFHALPALARERAEDRRFLDEITRIVSSAVGKAVYVQQNVGRLAADSINADARVISAVSRLAPRVILRYERLRSDVREADGSPRGVVMGAEIAAIRRSLDRLTTLMGVLAANPDFRRKSEFVGVD